jgi:hypothetical protein
MAAIVEIIRPTNDDDDVWRVTVDGRSVVAFYGPYGQQLAEYHRDALEELLALPIEGPGSEGPLRSGAAASFDDTPGRPVGSCANSIFPPTIN